MHMQGISSATANEANKIYAVDGEGTLQIWNGRHTLFFPGSYGIEITFGRNLMPLIQEYNIIKVKNLVNLPMLHCPVLLQYGFLNISFKAD